MVRKKNIAHDASASSPHRASITAKGNSHLRAHRNPTASHLSLTEVARNTERQHSWHSDLKLRHAQVSFVSAGSSEEAVDHDILGRVSKAIEVTVGDVPLDPEQPLASMTVDQGDIYNHEFCPVRHGRESDTLHDLSHAPSGTKTHTATVHEGDDIFVVDTEGSTQHIETGMPWPTIRDSPSPVPSNSSEEVIIFRGRNRSRQVCGASLLQKMGRLRERQPIKASLDFEDALCDITYLPVGKTQTHWPKCSSAEQESQSRRCSVESLRTAQGNTFKADLSIDCHIRPHPRSARVKRKKKQDEAMEDYIQNMQINLEENYNQPESKFFGIQDPRDSNDDIWQDVTEPSLTKEAISIPKTDCTDRDLHDFDDLSTSSDVPEAIVSILSRRQRPSGVHYLVVWAGHDTDDARWVPRSSLEMNGATKLISIFESNKNLSANVSAVSSGSDNEALEIADLEDETDITKDDDDLVERKKSRMTDEQIAMRLAKQEQLELGSSEVMLFAGDEVEDWSDKDDINSLLQAARNYSKPKVLKRERKWNGITSVSSFADAAIQDSYGGFDIMDHERPSLRRRPKGRRGVLPLELSDSELEASMLLTWENDRTKKILQKQDRLALRVQGLLNRKSKLDMKVKYSEGMSISSFKEEIKDFLDSEEKSISFPPMDKKDRMWVHEFATAFNLKSISVGGGRSRYPSLYKTSHTLPYSDGLFNGIEARLNRPRFLSRKDHGAGRGRAARSFRASRGGGGMAAAVSYKDGEIVGAAAPELGSENRGRAMLEKMGWSTGTALGALNNKGIMEPVAHIVKTTKAGLG